LKKKDQTPLLLKIVRWLYPKAERYMPSVAHWYFTRLFFTPLHYHATAKELKALKFSEPFSVIVQGKKVQCYSWGKGERIVLLVHGWAGRATQLRRFIKPLLAKGYRVVGIDGPAHGNSEGTRTSILEFEEAFRQVFKEVGEPEAIIAHSFGGGAVLFSAVNGLPVKKLINIATPTIGDEIINTYLRAINGSAKTGDYFRAYMIREFGKSFNEFTSLYFVKHLPQRIDLLLVHDEDDKEVSIRHPLALLEIYPQAQLFKTKGLGHTRILKDDAVIQKCVTFIVGESSKD